jgi:hypothetical protein
MQNELDLRKITGLLADEERFKIIAAVALGADTLEKIAAMTGRDNPAVIKALVKLEGAGLILKNNDAYSFNFDILPAFNRGLSQALPKKPPLTGLARFFKDGKLTVYPKDQNDRLAVLEHIISRFETGKAYPEKEVNEKLKEVHPDYASFRRYLTDAGFFTREQKTDGEKTVTVYHRVK